MYPNSSLNEIAEINPPRPQLSLEPETEVSFVPMGDVTDSGRWHSRQVRQFQEVNKGYTCFLNNDVLFAKITPCMENGKGCLVTGLENNVGFGSTEFHVLRARTNGDSGFIYQWSIYIPFRLKAAASMTGSAGQQRVPASFLETFKIPAIEKTEQTKIAEILSTMDHAIEQTEALIAKQQRIKTGLMQDLLTRGIDEHGNLRSEQTHQFKDSPLGRIPVEWDVEKLDVLATRGSGHTPNKRRAEYWNGGIKWVSLADSSKLDHVMIEETDKEISDLGLKNSSAVMHSKGTVILSRDAGVGKSAILGENMAVSQHFMAWRCKPARLDNYYLYYWLQRDKPKFEGIASGSTIVTIGLQFFREYTIAAPRKVSEQKQISEILSNVDRSIQQFSAGLCKLRRLSGNHNDKLHLKAYSDKSKHEASIKSFKMAFGGEEDGVTGDLGIVIVNNMLLTGFDAPVEQVMYLDKVIVAHNLLQAIARVNRVSGAAKDKGFVVDYVGIGHHLKKAIDTYDEREQKEVIDALSFPEEELNELIASHAAIMDLLKKHGLTDLTDHDAFFDLFYDEDLRFDYMLAFKKLTRCLNLVFPARQALDYLADYQALTEINVLAGKHFRDERLS